MLFSELPILVNIINLFNYSKLIKQCDIDELELTIADLIDHFIETQPLSVSNYNFHTNINDYLYNIIHNSISNMYNDNQKESLQEELIDIIEEASKKYFSKYMPLRSCPDTYVRKIPNISKMKEKINIIENIPQPEQRTPEWYLFRHNLITASSAWKVFKSQSSINQLIVEKCKSINVDKYNSVNTSSPMHHGNKYEDVSILFYENLYKTKIKDYGCIKHSKYSCLGASPDGINVDDTSDRYGRMLEIKNPTTRELTGIPKEDYWIQMQLQMETCNLNECDFLETVFKEYEDEDSFNSDGTFTYNNDNKLKGIIVYFMKDGKPFYEYMPLYMSQSDSNTWIDTIMDKNKDLTWIKNIYWWLDEYSCVLVLRNKNWFKHAIAPIEHVWSIIEQERISGFDHRIPKRNKNSQLNSTLEANDKNSCMINVDNLKNQIIYIETKFEPLDISGT